MPTENQIAEQLRTYFDWLDHEFGDVETSDTDLRAAAPSGVTRVPVHQSAESSRRLALVAACLVLIAGAVAVIALSAPDTSGDAVSPGPSARVELASEWSEMEPPPLASRWDHISVGTDRGWFVWGGVERDDTAEYGVRELADGALFDGATGEWQVLPEAPIAPVDAHVGAAVWTGTEIIVVQGRRTPQMAAFHPATLSWRTIDIPEDIRDVWPTGEAGFQTGWPRWIDDRLVVFFPGDPEQGFDPGVLVVDPSASSWSVGATPPATLTSLTGPIASSDTDLFVLGGAQRNLDASCTNASALYRYSVITDTWTTYSTNHQLWMPAIAGWTGNQLVVAGGTLCGTPAGGATKYRGAAAFDATTERWSTLSDMPVDHGWSDGPTVVIGDRIAAIGPNNQVVIYDASANRWTLTPPFLTDGTTSGDTNLTAVGSRLAIWSPGIEHDDGGGNRTCCSPNGQAYIIDVPDWTN